MLSTLPELFAPPAGVVPKSPLPSMKDPFAVAKGSICGEWIENMQDDFSP